ncbi:Protein dopey-1 [Nosema granulosis]|uniref:Protein dopey-1 n=1 Tax=Nosema granulosis TaxID=83296 RepID=A0A9P6GYN4_9MICR|nr:Protein dopey-1 [Nosema granulosis]
MNSKNQKYIVEITKKLESFKNAKEWSDFISLLASLDSTIKTYALPYVPRKELLSKRLEQCLNPLLPAGVHNKALETFSIIFETISKKELEDNFGIYTLGLFTFASHSRLLVINHYLDVIEKHIVPFGKNIEVYTPNIIMGLLPPLESRVNEFYNRAFLILNNFKSKIDEHVFYTAMWNLFLSDPGVRLPIVNYLLDTPIDVEKMAGDKELVIRALCKGLASKEALVLRGTLDVISNMFPLNTRELTNNYKYDLLEGMLRIFLRRDLSLNKRVFAWMGYRDNTDNQNIRLLKNTLVRYLNNEKDLLVFFKIFITLSSKSRISEQILESLLFKVLFQLKKQENLYSQRTNKLGEVELSKEASDVRSFSKSFLSEDLDVLWKIFYLKLQCSIEKDQVCDEKKSDEEKSDDDRPENYKPENCKPESESEENNLEDTKSQLDSKKTILPVDQDALKALEDFSSISIKDSLVSEINYEDLSADTSKGILEDMSCSDILYYIDFCCENYKVFDDNVSSTHLPILVLLILKHRECFDRKVLQDFLKHNTKRIKLESQQATDIDTEIFEKIDKFYKEEDVNILLGIQSGFVKSLIEYLHVLAFQDIENAHSFYIDFILNHRKEFIFDEYVKKYYDTMIDASLKTIGNSLRLFHFYGASCVKAEKLFIELWDRFCRQKIDQKPDVLGFKQPKWDISLDSEMMPQVSLNTNHQSNIRNFLKEDTNLPESVYLPKEGYPQDGHDKDYDYEKKAMDKKFIVVLIYDYNLLFRQKYEKYLLRKVSEDTKHNICLFIHYLFELENNTEYYFYNLFFIINNKISGRDPVITALIKSLVNFEDAYLFLVKKFESSSVLSKDFIYIDEPNLNQIKGIVKCLKNMISYSRRFREMLKTSTVEYSSCLFGEKKYRAKTFVYKILEYIFLCEIDIKSNIDNMSKIEIKYKERSQRSAESLYREIKIDCIKLIMNLLVLKVIDKNDVSEGDLPAIVSLLQVYRLDPAIILPSSILIRASGKQNLLVEFSSILDSKCFYYYDFLEFIFQLPVNQKKLILSSILSKVGKDNYGLMIKYEIIKEIIVVEDSSLDWSSIVQGIIKDAISFYEEDMSTIYTADDVVDRRSSAELLFSNSINQTFGIEHNKKFITFNSHTMDIKVRAIIKTANLIYSKLSGYFIEHLISLPFPKKFVKDLDFKAILFSNILSNILSSYNHERIFSFMLELEKVLSKEEKEEAYSISKHTLLQIINYRTETHPSTLLFLLKIFSSHKEGYEEVSSFLTIIYQSISYIQKNLDSRKAVIHSDFLEYSKIMSFLSNINYTEKIKSAHQTYIGFLIELMRHQDRVVSTCALGEMMVLSNNRSITESMWAKDFMEYFNQPDFFALNIEQKSILVGKVADYKIEVIDDLIARLNSSFFVSQASDISTKCTVLQRMAFLIFSASYDRYSSFNIKLIEIIPNLIQHSSNKIRKSVLFLIRVMLYRIKHSRLSTIFPILFTELLSILGRICDEDNEVIIEAFKILDMVFFLNTQEVLEFRNVLTSSLEVYHEEDTESNVTLFEKTFFKLKKRFDLEFEKNFTIKSKRSLFISIKYPDMNEIGKFLELSSEYYLAQDKHCQDVDKEETDAFIMAEFKNC